MHRSLRRAVAYSLILIFCVAAVAAAQDTEARPGVRVRLQAPGIVAGRYEGTVLTRDSSAIHVGGPTAAPVDVPFDRITSLEISRGKSRSAGAWRGIQWGAPIGLGLGLVLAPSLRECDPTCHDATASEKNNFVVAGAVSGVLGGAGIGAIIGRERWERFDVAPRTGVDTRSGRTQLGVRLAY